MYMEKEMSPADREQLTALMNSVYDTAVTEMAANRLFPAPMSSRRWKRARNLPKTRARRS
jgi:hypothetical protein